MQEDQKEVIKAWLDGETVQYQLGLNWCDCHTYEESKYLFFNSDDIYRIKPKNIVTSTFITQTDSVIHYTHTFSRHTHNLKLTWSPDGKTLLKAEVI